MQLKVLGQLQTVLAEGGAPPKPQFPRPIRLTTLDEPKIDSQLQTKIGEQLRSYYAELMNDPVPRRFIDLVSRLDRKH
jgi:hypothetical protein